jgi:hypothetical protein
LQPPAGAGGQRGHKWTMHGMLLIVGTEYSVQSKTTNIVLACGLFSDHGHRAQATTQSPTSLKLGVRSTEYENPLLAKSVASPSAVRGPGPRPRNRVSVRLRHFVRRQLRVHGLTASDFKKKKTGPTARGEKIIYDRVAMGPATKPEVYLVAAINTFSLRHAC